MCIKTPYPLLRGVRGGTRYSSPFTVVDVWNRSTGCRSPKSARVFPGQSRIEDPLRDVLKTCCSETPTVQHIIYNIHTGLFGTRIVLRKRLSITRSGVPLPRPRPPKKKINNLPKNVSPSNFPSPVR